MRDQLMEFESLGRLLMLGLALSAAFVALGGEVGAKEFGLTLACVGLNALRLRLKFERSNVSMVLFWTGLFGAAPLLYLLLHVKGLKQENLFETILVPPVIVALALPFQVFSAYLPSIPRAQHLLYAFVLVEVVLGIRQDRIDPIWPYLLLITFLFALCLIVTHVNSFAVHKGKGIRKRAHLAAPFDLLRFRFVFLLFPLVVVLLLATLASFVLLPRPSLADGQPSLIGLGDVPRGGSPGARSGDPSYVSPENGDSSPPPGDAVSSDAQVSGLSEGVELGDFGELLKSRRPVADVTMTLLSGGELPSLLTSQPLFLRAYTYDRFDGQSWSRGQAATWKNLALGEDFSAFQQVVTHPQDPRVVLRFDYVDPQGAQPFVFALPLMPERVMSVLDPKGEPVQMVLALDTVSGELQGRKIDAENTLGSLEAQCVVPLRSITGRRGQAMELKQSVQELTALPSSLRRELDQRWTEAGRFAAFEQHPIYLAQELEGWFRSAFRYSLEERPGGRDAILRFICDAESRVGHCEYFASAMLVALRYFGVPCRMCVGYAPQLVPEEAVARAEDRESVEGGAVPQLARWKILESNAHAWVEVFSSELGWHAFDPTAPEYRTTRPADAMPTTEDAQEPTSPEQDSSPEDVAQALIDGDPLRDFSQQARSALLTSVVGVAESALDFLADLRDAPFNLLPENMRPEQAWLRALIEVALLFAVLSFALRRLRKTMTIRRYVRSGYTPRRDKRAEASSELYRDLLSVLARQGLQRAPSQTPEEFAHSVIKRHGQAFQPLLEATDLFYRLRYGVGGEHEKRRYRRLLKLLAAVESAAEGA